MQKTKQQKKDAVVLEFVLIMYAPEEHGGDGSAVQEIHMDQGEFWMLKDHPCLSAPVQPAIDATAPDWMQTPDFDYVFGIWIEDGDAISTTSLTRAQYLQLKEKLASLRVVERAA